MGQKLPNPTEQAFQTPEQLGGYGLPLYENHWSAFMELLLLEAMEMFGPENWATVASYLNTSFSPEQVRDHYFRVYGDHTSQDQFKLIRDDNRLTMLIQNPEYDIYVAAHKRQSARIAREEKERRKAYGQYTQDMMIIAPAPQPPSRIPQQFGYEKSKKIFTQPFNEQAEVLIVGLKMNKDDDKLTRQNKMQVLKKYNELIVQRAIVQKEVISKNLMDCKYSIKKNELNWSQKQLPKKKSGHQRRRSGKNRGNLSEIQESKYVGSQFFESMKRTFEDDLSQGLHFIYTKVKKYDEEEKLKRLLVEYEEKCKMMAMEGNESEGQC